MSNLIWEPGVSLKEAERRVAQKALRHYGNNYLCASLALGINEKTLRSKLNEENEDGFETIEVPVKVPKDNNTKGRKNAR